jgi:hypothetical protein
LLGSPDGNASGSRLDTRNLLLRDAVDHMILGPCIRDATAL